MTKLFAVILSFALLAGCSSEPAKPPAAEKPQPKAPQTTSGTSALYKCYIAARGWQQDAQPFRLDSDVTPDSNGHDGKAVSWRAGFASPAHRVTKPYIWSNGDVSPGVEDTYSPSNTSTQVFNIQLLSADSDKAFEAAQKHGGDKLLEQDPNTPVFYSLNWNRQKERLEWHVMYGPSPDSAKLRILVNANTGEFIRVEE